jgi:DNA polymerase-3 subunit beta
MSDRVTFERAALLAALNTAGKVRPWRRDQNSPEMVQIAVERDVAYVSSVDLAIQITVAAACAGDGVTLYAPLGVLHALCNKAVEGATIALTPGEGSLLFQSGRSRSTINVMKLAAMPVRPTPTGQSGEIGVRELVAGLSAAAPATVDDVTRPFLGGVHMHASAGGVRFEAQDGNRIHAARQEESRIERSALIPRALARIAVGVIGDAGTAEIIVGDRAITFRVGGVELTGALMTASFPDITIQMAAVTSRELSVNAAALLADLDLVMTVGNPRDRDFRLDLGATCEASAFRVLGSSPDSGAVVLDASFVGAPLAIGFQFPLVRDALQLFGDADIVWRFGGPEEPSLIMSPAAPGVEAMLSPFRLAADHQRLAA